MLPDFGFAGYYLHAPSGLLFTRTRAYSASLARFINRDLLEEDESGPNQYGYVSNKPVSLVDPAGTQMQGYLPPTTPPTVAWDIGLGLITIWWLITHMPTGGTSDGGGFGTGLGTGYGNGPAWGFTPGTSPSTPVDVPYIPFFLPVKNPGDLYNDPATTPMKPVRGKGGGKQKQCSRPGGLQGAINDLNSMGPKQLKPIPTSYGPGVTGVLPDGTPVTIQPGNSDNPQVPTLEIGGPDPGKIRYP